MAIYAEFLGIVQQTYAVAALMEISNGQSKRVKSNRVNSYASRPYSFDYLAKFKAKNTPDLPGYF